MRRIQGAIAIIAVLAVGCMPKVEQPDIRLAGVRLASIGLDGGVVDVRLSVYNPNRFPLHARDLTYGLELEDPDGGWIPFTEGTLRDVDVSARDTAVVVVPVEFDFRDLGDALRGLLERGSFDYRLSGVVGLEGPVRRDIPYRHAGTVTPTGVR